MRKASISPRNDVKKDAIVHPGTRLPGVLAVTVTLLVCVGMPIPIAYAQQESTLITVGGIGSPGTITPVAGTGQAGFSGDNGSATLGTLFLPHRVSLDRMGNLFIPDLFNHRVRKVDPEGIITTVAGNGPAGDLTPTGDLSGDGGLATEAHLKKPQAAVFDAAGNMFILDSANNRVRRLDASTGIISTVVGNGPLGDGNGGFFGENGPANLAWLNRPAGLAMDAAGSLYVADVGNFRVRRVSPGMDGFITGASDEIITTVAGNGTNASSGEGGPATQAGLTDPHGLAFDLVGNLYIADFNGHVVQKVNPKRMVLLPGLQTRLSPLSRETAHPASRATTAPPQLLNWTIPTAWR
jgi:trimeric autotransporter adhesin